jgi:hypothetical protein
VPTGLLLSTEAFVLEDGKYSAWFRAEGGEGMGVITLADGHVSGGDTVLSYFGTYSQAGDAFTAHINTERHSPGAVPLFGLDVLEIELVGTSKGRTAAGKGTVKQLPGVALSITLVRIE